MTKDLWGQIQEELQETIGKNNFTNWISPLEFSDVVDGVANFKVPTTFLGNYVSQSVDTNGFWKFDRCLCRYRSYSDDRQSSGYFLGNWRLHQTGKHLG